MYKIILKSFNYLEEFAKLEIKTILNQEFTQIDKETFEIQAKDEKELTQITYNLVFYSRCFDGIYLKENENKQTKYQSLEKVEIDYKNTAIKVYDLIGDILIERNYKINEDENYLSHFLVNYCAYKLELHKEEKIFSIIDPMAELGDIIIETSLFQPRKPLYIQEKNTLPIYKEFKIMPPMPKPIKDKSKYQALVLEDSQFKKLRENINEASQKVRISKYEMDWLDVKFHKNDFDYAITFLPEFDDEDCPGESDEFLKEFLYQTEFICKKRICLISQEEISLKYAEKYELNLIDKTEIEVDEEPFIIYIFEPTLDENKKTKPKKSINN